VVLYCFMCYLGFWFCVFYCFEICSWDYTFCGGRDWI